MDFNEGRLVEWEKAKNIENRHADTGWEREGELGNIAIDIYILPCIK